MKELKRVVTVAFMLLSFFIISPSYGQDFRYCDYRRIGGDIAQDLSTFRTIMPVFAVYQLYEERPAAVIRGDTYAEYEIICTRDNIDVVLGASSSANIKNWFDDLEVDRSLGYRVGMQIRFGPAEGADPSCYVYADQKWVYSGSSGPDDWQVRGSCSLKKGKRYLLRYIADGNGPMYFHSETGSELGKVVASQTTAQLGSFSAGAARLDFSYRFRLDAKVNPCHNPLNFDVEIQPRTINFGRIVPSQAAIEKKVRFSLNIRENGQNIPLCGKTVKPKINIIVPESTTAARRGRIDLNNGYEVYLEDRDGAVVFNQDKPLPHFEGDGGALDYPYTATLRKNLNWKGDIKYGPFKRSVKYMIDYR